MKQFAVLIVGAAALAGVIAVSAGPVQSTAAAKSANLCRAGERVIYSCQFAKKLGSVCLGKSSVHYRFGRKGKPGMDLSSNPDWSNIHLGGNRSQAGLNQDYIRFTGTNATHYVVHVDETGQLNENPGRRSSGIVALRGDTNPFEIARLDCKSAANFDFTNFLDLNSVAPDGWDGVEDEGGPFELIY